MKHYTATRLFSVLVVLLALATSTHSQTLSGRVLDERQSPAAFATVRLLHLPDSVQVAAQSADAEGRFQFNTVAAGQYLLRAGLVGYTDAFATATESGTVDLQLQPASAQLDGVDITARRRMIEVKADRTVVNVEGSVLATGGSAYELLQRAPGVVITPQESVVLQGKGNTLVTIDGRPTQLDGAQLAAFLKGLPAEDIKSIELITNPSSRYDAEGVAGIVNIRLRRNRDFGTNGSVTLGNAQAVHRRTNGSASLNYRPGRLSTFGNYSVTDAQQSIDQDIERVIGGKTFVQSNPKLEDWRTHNLRTGADFLANSRHTFGVLAVASDYRSLTNSNILTRIGTENSAVVDSSAQGRFSNPEHNRRLNLNFNYRFADTSGREITFDADRIAFRMDGSNALLTNRYTFDNQWLGSENIQSMLGTDVDVWAFKTDAVQQWKSGLKVEAGAKFTSTQSRSNIAGQTALNGENLQPNYGRTNRADFDEQIAAAYTNVGREGSRWSWQAGLRMEYTLLEGRSTDLAGVVTPIKTVFADLPFEKNLFPTAYLQRKLSADGGNTLGLSFNRRIDRPAYQDLNPFIWQIDPYTSERGNPNLRPAYVTSGELKYTYKWAASASVGYARTTDAVSTIGRQQGEQAFAQPENIGQQDNWNFNLGLPTPIKSWWEGYAWLGVWHNRFRTNLPEGALDQRAWGGGCYLGQQWHLPGKLDLGASLWAQFPTSNGFFRNQGIWSTGLNVKKSLLHDRATVKLAFNDVFNSQRWVEKTDFGGLRASIRNDWESQSVEVQFSYRFGNQQVKTRERRSGAEDANGRIKGGKNG